MMSISSLEPSFAVGYLSDRTDEQPSITVMPYPDTPYPASLQAGTLPNFSNKKSINILTLTVSTFDFG